MWFDSSILSTLLLSRFQDIPFAYLFGLSKGGTIKAGSDVDVAFYYTGNESLIKFEIDEEFEKAIPGVIFDLVELQKADPILAFEVLHGTKLFVRPEAIELFLHFYSLTCRRYEDRIYWMNKQLSYRGYEVQWND